MIYEEWRISNFFFLLKKGFCDTELRNLLGAERSFFMDK